MDRPEKEIPLYTKIGIRVTAILLIIFSFLILKNCGGAIYYGLTTDDITIQKYYDMGYIDGARKVSGSQPLTDPNIENSVLQKTYRNGFRKGWDAAHPQETD